MKHEGLSLTQIHLPWFDPCNNLRSVGIQTVTSVHVNFFILLLLSLSVPTILLYNFLRMYESILGREGFLSVLNLVSHINKNK
jgi:hypothetical protein